MFIVRFKLPDGTTFGVECATSEECREVIEKLAEIGVVLLTIEQF